MSHSASGVRWLAGRSLALHLALLLALPMCGLAAWWQVHRALSGNALSWLYVFEWPAFSGIAVWLWWVLLTTRPRGPGPDGGQDGGDALLAVRSVPLRWDAEDEPGPLRAYNSYLAELNAGRKPSPPRRPARRLRPRRTMTEAEAHGS